jgi:hypothetical protein
MQQAAYWKRPEKIWRFAVALVALGAVAACERDSPSQPELVCGEALSFFEPSRDTAFVIDRNAMTQAMIPGRDQPLLASGFQRHPDARAHGPVSGVKGSWCSTDPNVARISDERVLAVSPGLATLYARDDKYRGDSITIEVLGSGYSVRFIGDDIGAPSTPLFVNDSGDVLASGPNGIVLWRDGVVVPVTSCQPTSLNNRRQISCAQGAIWENGSLSAVAIPGFETPYVSAVTDSGYIAGKSQKGAESWVFFIAGPDTTLTRYGVNTGPVVRRANDRREAVGIVYPGGAYPAAALFTPEGIKTIGGRNSAAFDISASGRVAGFDLCVWFVAPTIVRPRPFVWPGGPLGTTCTRPDRPNYAAGAAFGINDLDEAVGIIGVEDAHLPPQGRAAHWRDNRTIILDHVVDDRDWVLTDARDIDNAGNILAHGVNERTGKAGVVLVRRSSTP